MPSLLGFLFSDLWHDFMTGPVVSCIFYVHVVLCIITEGGYPLFHADMCNFHCTSVQFKARAVDDMRYDNFYATWCCWVSECLFIAKVIAHFCHIGYIKYRWKFSVESLLYIIVRCLRVKFVLLVFLVSLEHAIYRNQLNHICSLGPHAKNLGVFSEQVDSISTINQTEPLDQTFKHFASFHVQCFLVTTFLILTKNLLHPFKCILTLLSLIKIYRWLLQITKQQMLLPVTSAVSW